MKNAWQVWQVIRIVISTRFALLLLNVEVVLKKGAIPAIVTY
jgi:hypothetical protein